MFQSWRWLTFLHWRYEPGEIRRLLPKGLELDTFDGSAWVALTPFLLSGLRPPFVPALPWISHFPEMNVRTYVRGPAGEPGIWFFTLEADRLAAVVGARLGYGLPYRWADMHVKRGTETGPLDQAPRTFLSRSASPSKRANSTGFSRRVSGYTRSCWDVLDLPRSTTNRGH
jgi:uncharacterized protein YqjF (DUF2071 family)